MEPTHRGVERLHEHDSYIETWIDDQDRGLGMMTFPKPKRIVKYDLPIVKRALARAVLARLKAEGLPTEGVRMKHEVETNEAGEVTDITARAR